MKGTFIIYFCFLTGILIAQSDISKSISTNGAAVLDMDFKYADVEISTYNGSEIKVTGQVSINLGKDNDHLDLRLERKGDKIVLVSAIKNIKEIPYRIKAYDEEGNIVYQGEAKKQPNWDNFRDQLKDVEYSIINTSRDIEIKLQVQIPNAMKIVSNSEFGNIVIDNANATMDIFSKHGSIEAKFLNTNALANSKLESTHDWIDVSLPQNAKVSVRLQSNFGELMTDIPMDVDKSKSSSGSFEEIVYADINGGGPLLSLKAKHDNVYLRKGR